MREGGGGEKEGGIWGTEGGESPCQRGRKRQKVNTTRLVLSFPPSLLPRASSVSSLNFVQSAAARLCSRNTCTQPVYDDAAPAASPDLALPPSFHIPKIV